MYTINKVKNASNVCVQYVLYYIRFDLFGEMREEGWTGEELWDR